MIRPKLGRIHVVNVFVAAPPDHRRAAAAYRRIVIGVENRA
jgi:hypothetical protein